MTGPLTGAITITTCYYYHYRYQLLLSTGRFRLLDCAAPVLARPISLLRSSLLRLLDSNFPVNSLWAWEFHPLNIKIMFESIPLKSVISTTEIGRMSCRALLCRVGCLHAGCGTAKKVNKTHYPKCDDDVCSPGLSPGM